MDTPIERATSNVLWKGYNETLQLDMTILLLETNEDTVYTLVKLDLPNTGRQEAIFNAQWNKHTISGAIEDGSFETMVNNCYMNMNVVMYNEFLSYDHRVN